jgi:hypothetical protein
VRLKPEEETDCKQPEDSKSQNIEKSGARGKKFDIKKK